jgi:lipopolysaccharide biosynthesis glycosyltransferase
MNMFLPEAKVGSHGNSSLMRFSVAYCGDQNMEAPLHVAAASLLLHADPEWTIDLYFILSDFDQQRRDRLLRTLELTRRSNYQVHFVPPPPDSTFAGIPSLHGNLVTYYRFLLPQLVDADRLLYVDCDTICFTDVTPLARLPMPYPSGFVSYGNVSRQPESEFFHRLGLGPDTATFNAGVMLLDLAAWRAEGRAQSMLAFCRRYRDDLICCDQTALIATCAGKFTELDERYNLTLYPTTSVPDPAAMPGIYHFVGSPKPWDLGGRKMHRGFELYSRALELTDFRSHRTDYWRLSYWRRTYNIKGGYFRTLRRMLSVKEDD